jgi:hypothetical protein
LVSARECAALRAAAASDDGTVSELVRDAVKREIKRLLHDREYTRWHRGLASITARTVGRRR